MAKAKETGEKSKKKKQGLVQRMMFGSENKPDLTPEKMNVSKWAQFKNLFFGRFGTMVALNLLTCLFALPAVLVMVLFYMNKTIGNGFIPYSSNFGIGYPVVTDAARLGGIMTFTYNLYEFSLLIPCIAIFALGVAGNLYVMRKLIWDEPTRTVKDFFRGIGKCWLPALLMGVFFGLTLLLFEFSLGYFDAYGLSKSVKILCIVLSSILLAFMILFTSFFMTQTAAFKMRPMVLIRNSVLFVLGTNVQAIVFIGIGIAPVFLMFIPGITMLLAMLYIFLGFSYSTLVISLFCHRCYERFLYDKIDRSSAAYTKRGNDISDDDPDRPAQPKKRAPVQYKNPKKRKKSIDEGASITPLAPTFRREDLERLEKEHERVMAESEDSEDELGELEDDEPDLTDTAVDTDNVAATDNVAPTDNNTATDNSAATDNNTATDNSAATGENVDTPAADAENTSDADNADVGTTEDK